MLCRSPSFATDSRGARRTFSRRIVDGPCLNSRCMPNSVFPAKSGEPQLKFTGQMPACPVAEPISQSGVFRERFTESAKHDGADSLLLVAQVVFK